MKKTYLRGSKKKQPKKAGMEINLNAEEQELSQDLSNTSSVFDNLPERNTNLSIQAEHVPPPGELSHTTSSNEMEYVVHTPEPSPKVYSIMSGDDDDENYSFYPPNVFMSNGSQTWFVSATHLFKRGVISQNVLGEEVEVSYATSQISGAMEFPLSKGVLMKEIEASEIEWLQKTKDQAMSEIKDLVILKYNQVVPNLVNQLNTLQTQVKQQQQRQQQQNQRKQANDDLISL